MTHKHEVPVDFTVQTDDSRSNGEPLSRARPYSDMQALMEAAPGAAIENSVESLLRLRDVLADAIDDLPDRHRWVLEQRLIAKVPLRTLANWMSISKSRVHTLEKEALVMLRVKLNGNLMIAAYLDE